MLRRVGMFAAVAVGGGSAVLLSTSERTAVVSAAASSSSSSSSPSSSSSSSFLVDKAAFEQSNGGEDQAGEEHVAVIITVPSAFSSAVAVGAESGSAAAAAAASAPGSGASSVTQRVLVLSGPSGVGKSVIIKELNRRYPGAFGFSVSHTSRNPRPGEQDGVDYHFTSREKMIEGRNRGEFLETAEFAGNFYGTSYKAIKDVQEKGCVCVLDIELQGVLSLRRVGVPATCILIRPPSMEILKQRLIGRGTESAEKVSMRLETAEKDLAYIQAHPGVFDAVVTNDDLHKCVDEIEGLIADQLKGTKKQSK